MSHLRDALNDKQKTAVYWLAQHIGGYLDRRAVQDRTGMSDSEYDTLMSALIKKDAVRIRSTDKCAFPDHRLAGNLEVTPEMDQIVHEVTAPKDYPKGIRRWISSKPWSVPLWVLFVVVPALAGYITCIKIVLSWLGITK